MGFHRHVQPAAPPIVIHIDDAVEEIIQQMIEEALPPREPFNIEPDCFNPAGHHFISSCSDIVCVHCARIAWR